MVHKVYHLIQIFKGIVIARHFKLSLFLAICCYAGNGLFVADNSALAESSTLEAQNSDALNAVLLMDSSASMLVNDPDKLRDQGARLLLQFLKSGDKLAIVSFDENAKVVRPLSPFNSDQIASVQNTIADIEASGQYTDLNAGLEAAKNILTKVPGDEGKPVIILLSDGKMDPAPNRGSAESHLDDLTTKILPSLKSSNLKVYTLAFSQDADRPLLQHIAQASDGINWFTPNSDTIHESFADLFLSLKKPQVVPYGSKGFKIDADVEEATFYVNQPEGVKIEIEDPNEERFSAEKPGDEIRWFDGKKFSVITILQPQAGEWKLIGVDPDAGFATILTNLKLVTDWPNAIPVEDSVLLQARLYEGKIPVDLEAMAQAVTFAFQVTPSDRVSEPIIREFLNDEGKQGDEKAGDGIFSQKISIKDAGEYRLRLVAKGPTFERQMQIPFRVRPPLMTFVVEQGRDSDADSAEQGAESGHDAESDKGADAGHDQHKDSHTPPDKTDTSLQQAKSKPPAKNEIVKGSQYAVLKVLLNEEASTFKDISVKIVAVDKSRNKYSIPAKANKASHDGAALVYQASAAALPKDNLFELRAYLEAKTRDGGKIEEESEIIKFSRKSITELEPVPVVEEHHEEPVESKPPVAQSGIEWIALVIVTLLNFALGGALFFLLKKKKSSGGSDGQTLSLPEIAPEIFNGLDDLEKRSQIDTVNLDEERYSAPETDVAASASAAQAPEAVSNDSSEGAA